MKEKNICEMLHQFRQRTPNTPEFHHYDLPSTVLQDRHFNHRDLMLDSEYLLLRFEDIHCRITFSSQHRNFKIIRPDNVSHHTWNDLKRAGERIVSQYVDWYATPPPATLPREMRKKFLYAAKQVCVQEETPAQATATNADSATVDYLEEGETRERVERREEKSVAQDVQEKIAVSLKSYFCRFPHMEKHPYLYAMICGKLVPSATDVPLLATFVWSENSEAIKQLFRAVIGNGPDNGEADATCRALASAHICPLLTDVNGHLSYDIDVLARPTAIARDLRHDQNIDLLLLGAFARESARLHLLAPSVEHMQSVLPSNLYRLYNQAERIRVLRHSRLWRTFFYTRITCNNAQHRQRDDFDICDGCNVQCARAKFFANWILPQLQRRVEQRTQDRPTAQKRRYAVEDRRRFDDRNDKRRREASFEEQR